MFQQCKVCLHTEHSVWDSTSLMAARHSVDRLPADAILRYTLHHSNANNPFTTLHIKQLKLQCTVIIIIIIIIIIITDLLWRRSTGAQQQWYRNVYIIIIIIIVGTSLASVKQEVQHSQHN